MGGTTVFAINSGTKTISGGIGGWTGLPASIVKDGAGALVLAGTNTCSGATTIIEEGILQVDGSIAASSNLVVQSGATLSGGGSVAIGHQAQHFSQPLVQARFGQLLVDPGIAIRLFNSWTDGRGLHPQLFTQPPAKGANQIAKSCPPEFTPH